MNRSKTALFFLKARFYIVNEDKETSVESLCLSSKTHEVGPVASFTFLGGQAL